MHPEGGYKLITAAELLNVIAAANAGVITFGALRAYLGCFELIARREAAQRVSHKTKKTVPHFDASELASLLGVSRRRAARDISLLRSTGLVIFTENAVGIPATPYEGDSVSLLSGRATARLIPVPRRLLRYLCRCRKASVVKTILAYLLRGLTLTREGTIKAAGTIKVSWISKLCGLSERAVRLARAELIRLGWITRDEGSMQRKLNRDGAYFRINLGWTEEERAGKTPQPAANEASELAPLMAENRTAFAPPIKEQETPIGSKNQKALAGPLWPLPAKFEQFAEARPVASGVCTANRKERTHGIRPKMPGKPDLRDIQPSDLRRLSRLKDLYAQATRAGWLPRGEASFRNFIAAAARATRVNGDAVRIFVGIVKRGLWHHLSQSDEDRASLAITREREREGKGSAASSRTVPWNAGECALSYISYIRNLSSLSPESHEA